MEILVSNFELKVKVLLERFFEPTNRNFDECLKKLCTRLWEQEEKEVESTLLVLPIFSKWIKEAVVKWGALKVTPQTDIACFTLSLVSLLSKNEERFCNLNNNNFFIKLVNVLKARHCKVASVKLGYIKLLSSFLCHTSGVEWMIPCNFWEDILQMSLSDQNEEVARESTRFMWTLLENSVVVDEDFCNNIVKRIMLPLGENIFKTIEASSSSSSIEVTEESEYLIPTLKLIGNILEYFLECIYFDRGDFQILLVFLKNFHLEERISDLMIIAQTKCLAFDLGKIMFTMQFLELYVKVIANTLSIASINATIQRMKDNYLHSVSKEEFKGCMEFCSFGQLFWSLIELKLPNVQKKKGNEPTCFVDQFVMLQTLPYYEVISKHYLDEKEICDQWEEEFRDLYVDKLFKIMGHDAIRTCYFWRDHISGRPGIVQLAILCTDRLMRSRKYLSRDQAIAVVQCLIYNISDIVSSVKEHPQKIENILNETSYIVTTTEILMVLIEEFHITWKDSLETIDLLVVGFDFLIIHNWPTSILIQILKMINVAIANYMAPNLALLVDKTTDSTTSLLGPILYAKLFHELAEVKGAALEVVRTMATMSSNKFPSLQKVLMDSELPTLVVKMSTCDGESFVRATAIKCLQEMIQVEEIWNNALKTEDLTQKMRDVLLNETEGIVRVEAATFMCVAYEHQQFPKDTLDSIYETMIYSSTTDLHWEVKVRALGFWDKVIKNHLQNQGMIDDSFPNVTFSKEHRKIVTLTDSEIRKRLLKVLSQLSSIGCLGVLMSAIKDDCDMEVSKTAVKITQRLVDLFKKYNLRTDCSTPTSPLPTENGMSAAVSMSSGISIDDAMDSPASTQPHFNEEIIDQIVNSKDVNLLKNVYAPSDYGSVSNYDIQVRKIVTPNEFLQFTQQDLNAIISEKKKWLNGIEDLGSLLDDMLKTYDDDVNKMDCY